LEHTPLHHCHTLSPSPTLTVELCACYELPCRAGSLREDVQRDVTKNPLEHSISLGFTQLRDPSRGP
jgi:hypothetical protein